MHILGAALSPDPDGDRTRIIVKCEIGLIVPVCACVDPGRIRMLVVNAICCLEFDIN